MELIYFDSCATTKISERAFEKMIASSRIYGNPSSLHAAGIEAEKILSEARSGILASLGVRNKREWTLVFTSGGSEADNMALLGAAHAKKLNLGKKIVITDGEHPAIEKTARILEEEGYCVERLSTVKGVIDKDELALKIKDAFMLSVMAVSNETGADYSVGELFSLAKKLNPDIITHTDAVQGFMKIPFVLSEINADMISISGHKIHAPKGVGALAVKNTIIRSKKIIPLIVGGMQESSLRAGTENITGIAAFGEAAIESMESFGRSYSEVLKMKEYIIQNLERRIKYNSPEGKSSPYIISVTLPSVKSETMLNYLSSKGICVSSGSACSSRSGRVSASLLAFGLREREADCTIRISLSRYNTFREADILLEELKNGIHTLAKI